MRCAQNTVESIELAIFLALSGGLMDAYSYLVRGHVFANAQTGNLLLFGVYMATGEFARASHYILPVIAFAVGIGLTHLVSLTWKYENFTWHIEAVIFEIVVLASVGFVPEGRPLLANCITSFACGIQVQAFRVLHGRPFATTMCIGNLRSGTHELVTFLTTKKKQALEDALLYYGVIIFFVFGAILGSGLIPLLGTHTIWVSPALLTAALIILLVNKCPHAKTPKKAAQQKSKN